MTKIDMCDIINTNKWIKYYEEKGIKVIPVDLINKKNISDKSKIINLYRCFGYTKNDITKILYIENSYISLISICISVIFTFLIFIILKITIYYNPFLFSKFPIIYNYFAIIISLIIIFVINIYNIKFVRKNILGDLWKLFW